MVYLSRGAKAHSVLSANSYRVSATVTGFTTLLEAQTGAKAMNAYLISPLFSSQLSSVVSGLPALTITNVATSSSSNDISAPSTGAMTCALNNVLSLEWTYGQFFNIYVVMLYVIL